MEKPRKIVFAVNLLWVSFGLGVANGILSGLKTSTHVAPEFIFADKALLIGFFAIMALLIFMISAGRNWARITFGVLFLLGMPLLGLPEGAIMFLNLKEVMHPRIDSIVGFIQTALQGYAMYLVFTKPGNTWFHKTP